MQLTDKQKAGLSKALTRYKNHEKYITMVRYASLDLTFLDKLSEMA